MRCDKGVFVRGYNKDVVVFDCRGAVWMYQLVMYLCLHMEEEVQKYDGEMVNYVHLQTSYLKDHTEYVVAHVECHHVVE